MSTPVLSSEPEATPPSANLSGVLALMEDLVSEVAEESRAKTTRYQQGQQWKSFSEWCDARGLQSLPADPETVAVFIFTQGIGGKKPNTLRGYASSIAAEHRSEGHDNPCTDRVAMVIKGFVNRAKEAGQREKRAKPLTGEDLEKIRETACNPRKTDRGMERFSNARRRGLVDIALISVMRDALLRRSEAAEILRKHIAPQPDGSGPAGAGKRRSSGPLAHVRSPRDNWPSQHFQNRADQFLLCDGLVRVLGMGQGVVTLTDTVPECIELRRRRNGGPPFQRGLDAVSEEVVGE